MSVKNKPAKLNSGYLFISGSVFRRIPLFREIEPAKLFLATLEAYRKKFSITVHAYALMPDHYHLLIWFPSNQNLSSFFRDFKSYAAKEILEWLRKSRPKLLHQFRLPEVPARARESQFCILQKGNYVKALKNGDAAIKVTEYIHLNPVKARLAQKPESYAFSSAAFYANKTPSIVELDWIETGSAPPPGRSLGARE